MDLIIEQFDKNLHQRASFDCGVQELNIFLHQYANQNQQKNISKTYVAVNQEDLNNPKRIYGYYTLASGHLNIKEISQEISCRLPKHPVPIIRIARLATDTSFQGQGIGGFLLYQALNTILDVADKIGIYAVVVDAKNDIAKSFYKSYEFIELQNNALTLFLPLKTIQKCRDTK